MLGLLALALALAGGATARRAIGCGMTSWLAGAEMPARSRFMALMAMAWSALLVLLIVARTIAILLRCRAAIDGVAPGLDLGAALGRLAGGKSADGVDP